MRPALATAWSLVLCLARGRAHVSLSASSLQPITGIVITAQADIMLVQEFYDNNRTTVMYPGNLLTVKKEQPCTTKPLRCLLSPFPNLLLPPFFSLSRTLPGCRPARRW